MAIYSLYDGEVQIEYGKHPNAPISGRMVEGYWRHPWQEGDSRIPRVTGVDSPLPWMVPAIWGSKHDPFDTTARDLGTEGHRWIEAFFSGTELFTPPPGLKKQLEDFVFWAEQMVENVHACEQKVYSRQWHYAGTLDLDADVKGIGRCVVDFKFSQAQNPYYTWATQTAAYTEARQEELNLVYDGRVVLVLTEKGPKMWASTEEVELETDVCNFLAILEYAQTKRPMKWTQLELKLR